MANSHQKDDLRHRCETYSIPEAGVVVGVGKNKAYELVNNGILPSIDLDGVKRVPKKRLHAMINGDEAVV